MRGTLIEGQTFHNNHNEMGMKKIEFLCLNMLSAPRSLEYMDAGVHPAPTQAPILHPQLLSKGIILYLWHRFGTQKILPTNPLTSIFYLNGIALTLLSSFMVTYLLVHCIEAAALMGILSTIEGMEKAAGRSAAWVRGSPHDTAALGVCCRNVIIPMLPSSVPTMKVFNRLSFNREKSTAFFMKEVKLPLSVFCVGRFEFVGGLKIAASGTRWRLTPPNINSVPLHPYVTRRKRVNGGKMTFPTLSPHIAIPRANGRNLVKYWLRMTGMQTIRVPNPKPVIVKKKIIMISKIRSL